jgi:hypothetical protein
MRTTQALSLVSKSGERPLGYDFFRTPEGQKYHRRAQAEAARIDELRQRMANRLSAPHVMAAQRALKAQVAEHMLSVDVPTVLKFEAHTHVQALLKDRMRSDAGIRALGQHLRQAWLRDPMGTFTVADLQRLRKHYTDQFPRSAAAEIIGQNLPRLSAQSSDVEALAKAAERIDDQRSYDAFVVSAGLDGDDLRAVRARAILRDLVNQRLAQEEYGPTTDDIMASNPGFTYGQAVGYASGIAAAKRGDQFAGLDKAEWQNATDDYAQGYRQGFGDGQKRAGGRKAKLYAIYSNGADPGEEWLGLFDGDSPEDAYRAMVQESDSGYEWPPSPDYSEITITEQQSGGAGGPGLPLQFGVE